VRILHLTTLTEKVLRGSSEHRRTDSRLRGGEKKDEGRLPGHKKTKKKKKKKKKEENRTPANAVLEEVGTDNLWVLRKRYKGHCRFRQYSECEKKKKGGGHAEWLARRLREVRCVRSKEVKETARKIRCTRSTELVTNANVEEN